MCQWPLHVVVHFDESAPLSGLCGANNDAVDLLARMVSASTHLAAMFVLCPLMVGCLFGDRGCNTSGGGGGNDTAYASRKHNVPRACIQFARRRAILSPWWAHTYLLSQNFF